MKDNNPFEEILKLHGNHIPRSIGDAAVYVTDTLYLAWAAARSIFKDEAKPEHALKILELFLSEAIRNERKVGEYEDDEYEDDEY